jgi:AcrR family transcriptional regulator
VGGKRDENRKRRTQELCDAALALFLAKGIEPVTIDEIVGAASVAKGSFYRYFEDKAELVDVLLEPVALRLREALSLCEEALRAARTEQELVGAYQGFAAALSATVFESPDVVRLYLQECRTPDVGARRPVAALADEVQRGALTLTHAARAHGLLRDLDARVSATAVVGAVEHLLFRFLSGGQLGPLAEVPGAIVSLVLDGLRNR